MRPIVINLQDQNSQYNAQAELAVEAIVKPEDVGNQPRSKRRLVVEADVNTVLTRLEGLLQASWDPQGTWDSNTNRATAKRLAEDAGTGYKNASYDLLTQTGYYCSFCDTPLFSGLQATPVAPLAWLPQQAFNLGNLLLICPACEDARGDKPRRNDTTRYALPNAYWQGLQNGALLPFEYKLFRIANFLQAVPIPDQLINSTLSLAYQLGFIRVDRSGDFNNRKVKVDLLDLVSIHKGLDSDKLGYPKFSDLYQLFDLANLLELKTLKGLIKELEPLFESMNQLFKNFNLASIGEEEYSLAGLRLHFRLADTPEINNFLTKLVPVLLEFKAQRTIYLALHIKARASLPSRAAMNATIELFRLNDYPVFGKNQFVDRRLELRTMTYFKAIALREQYFQIEQLKRFLMEQLKYTIAATGFWGIWLSVFGVKSGIQAILGEVMPGTANINWRG